MSRPSRKGFRSLILIPIFGGLFWVTALIASTIPGLLVLGVNVHGLGTASYAADPTVALAPLSQQIYNDVSRDTGTVATPGGDPTPISSPTPVPGPTPVPSPTLQPLPVASPLPTLPPVPSILPSPTPTPTAGWGTITGQVIDSVTRLGIAAATVTSTPGASTTTDANGNFAFSLAAGTYTLTASATGYSSASQSVSVSGGGHVTVSIKLAGVVGAATGSIKGSVTQKSTTMPVVAATITLSNGLAAETDLAGGFGFPVVSNGTYTLTVSALNYVTQSVSVTVRGGHVTNVSVALVHA
ncbi:MAG: carboxypeptidase regulatory-like domain-containing protein [Candidatus Dormibacter sp.]